VGPDRKVMERLHDSIVTSASVVLGIMWCKVQATSDDAAGYSPSHRRQAD
jgi:hypothetical protein